MKLFIKQLQSGLLKLIVWFLTAFHTQ